MRASHFFSSPNPEEPMPVEISPVGSLPVHDASWSSKKQPPTLPLSFMVAILPLRNSFLTTLHPHKKSISVSS